MNDTWIITIPFIITVFALFIKLFQWLWNATMPDVFETKKINYWQAFKVLLIAGFLFGGHSGPWNMAELESAVFEINTDSVNQAPNSTMPSRIETKTN